VPAALGTAGVPAGSYEQTVGKKQKAGGLQNLIGEDGAVGFAGAVEYAIRRRPEFLSDSLVVGAGRDASGTKALDFARRAPRNHA
jgi:hypothetical protein